MLWELYRQRPSSHGSKPDVHMASGIPDVEFHEPKGVLCNHRVKGPSRSSSRDTPATHKSKGIVAKGKDLPVQQSLVLNPDQVTVELMEI